MLGKLIGSLFKALLEVVSNLLVDLLSKPDVVKPDVEPVLDRVVEPDNEELVSRFDCLT